jgi:hypothetical protein
MAVPSDCFPIFFGSQEIEDDYLGLLKTDRFISQNAILCEHLSTNITLIPLVREK